METLLTGRILNIHTRKRVNLDTVSVGGCVGGGGVGFSYPDGQVDSLSCDVELLCEKRCLQGKKKGYNDVINQILIIN